MPLFPFSPSGVKDKISELYALSNEMLNLEAAAIQKNFRAWVRQNFDLDLLQNRYMEGINEDIVNYFGMKCSLCFLNRLDIVLVYPTPPAIVGYSKWTDIEDNIKVCTNGNGKALITGSLVFTFSYRLKKVEVHAENIHSNKANS